MKRYCFTMSESLVCKVTVLDLMKVVGRLSSSVVLPASLQYKAFDKQQILELSDRKDYEVPIEKEVKLLITNRPCVSGVAV